MADKKPLRVHTGARSHKRSRVLLISVVAVPIAILAVVIWQHAPSIWLYHQYEPQSGDIIFQSCPDGAFTRLIEGATRSRISHCDIVVQRDGEWRVLEALGTVHETALFRWTRRGRAGEFMVYRLKDKHLPHIDSFVAAAREYLGRPYDFRFRMDDDALYCSELVFKAFKAATGENLGDTSRVRDLNWEPFKEYIEELESGPVPLERVMITPVALTRAAQVELVFGGGLLEQTSER